MSALALRQVEAVKQKVHQQYQAGERSDREYAQALIRIHQVKKLIQEIDEEFQQDLRVATRRQVTKKYHNET